MLNNLPDPKLYTREQIKEMLASIQYGFMPPKPEKISFSERIINENAFAGKCIYSEITIKVTVRGKDFAFPARLMLPKISGKCPTVVFMNFNPAVPDHYYPAEEIADRGVAVISFYYRNVTTDDNDFANGLADLFPERPGKLVMWAWAASRCVDYLETRDFVDFSHLAVAGHSRLGKTALVAGANDERFTCAYSNNSGCSGAATFRGKQGEDIEAITRQFPYWFTLGFNEYSGREYDLPFDQHFLMALIAPRKIYVTSAAEDSWADPVKELETCRAVTPIYEALGLKGLVESGDTTGEEFTLHGGNVGYHRRKGTHYMSRYDWNKFLDFFLAE